MKPRPCGCKGCRTCLICETQYGADNLKLQLSLEKEKGYVYCPFCNKAWKGWDLNLYQQHPNHQGDSIDYPGVFIYPNFLTENEENVLIQNIDEIPWDQSQSGRRKQNFGPKTNFKKQKITPGLFDGFPQSTKFIQDRFNNFDLLKGYEAIEQCSLEYDPNKGASIDPHIDDCWIWGERIITVNLLSDSVLTMTPYYGETKKYNLNSTNEYGPTVQLDGKISLEYKDCEISAYETSKPKCNMDVVVRIPMMRRSLLVIYGEARYHWEHFVLREDVPSRRVCLAYREFTPPYMTRGPYEEIGDIIRHKAKQFWDHKSRYQINCD